MNPLKHLNDYGQVIWLDFLSRRFIADGSLKRLIDEDGLAGVTSNPSIFEKAIVSSSDYDASLEATDRQLGFAHRIHCGAGWNKRRRAPVSIGVARQARRPTSNGDPLEPVYRPHLRSHQLE